MNCPTGCVPMLDVSASQGVVDWSLVYAAGYRAVMVEHGIGNDGANPLREAQVKGAQDAGLRVGAYSFVYPIGLVGAGRDAGQQAALHASFAVPGVTYDLPEVIDLEWPETTQWPRWGCTSSQIVQWVMRYSLARPGVTRMYTMPSFIRALGYPDEFGRFDLWIAEWTEGSANVPHPWSQWAAWQHSSKGIVEGVTGPVDLSWLRVPPSAISTVPDLGPTSSPTLPGA